MAGVLVLNADLSVLCFIDWQTAVTRLLQADSQGIPMAQIYEADPERTVRSPSTTVPFPRIILMTRYVYVPFHARNAGDVTDLATNRDILDRDKHTCVYCGRAGASTVDHVMPQSRGGRNSWENLAACCKGCNQRKADRTPEEAGMRLRWHPWRPDKTGYTQRMIWASLEQAAG
jgi:hypothetical protein